MFVFVWVYVCVCAPCNDPPLNKLYVMKMYFLLVFNLQAAPRMGLNSEWSFQPDPDYTQITRQCLHTRTIC